MPFLKRGSRGTMASRTSGDCDCHSQTGYRARFGTMLLARNISPADANPVFHGAPCQKVYRAAMPMTAGALPAQNRARRIQRSRRRDDNARCAKRTSGIIARLGRTSSPAAVNRPVASALRRVPPRAATAAPVQIAADGTSLIGHTD